MEEDQTESNPGQSHVAQAGPNLKPMHEDFIATFYPEVHKSLKLTTKEQVHIENPLNSSGTLSSIKNLEDVFTFGEQFLNDKSTKEELGKANVETEVESMVTVPIHQASSLVPPLSTLIIDLSPPKPMSPLIQEPIITATTATTTLPPPPPPLPLQSITNPNIATRVSALEKRSADFKQKKSSRTRQLNLLHPGDLSEFQMKEILRDRMFESGPYESHPDHTTLYESLEITSDSREAPSSSSKQKPTFQSEHPVNDDPIPEDIHLSESKVTGVAHLPKIKTRQEWLKPLPEEETLKIPKLDWVIPRNDLPETKNNWVDAMAKTLEELVLSLWTESKRDYDISSAYDISHWWFKPKKLYITRHNAPSNRNAVRSHMKILSVVSLKTYSRYGYTFLKEIVLRRAGYKEYKILEANFKNMHPNDFEDLNIVIKKRLEDLQLGIESYQTKINIAQLRWDATDFLFKEDYTIVHKPRAVIYKDRNNQKKMMRKTKVHKFSDDTLRRILKKLDYMVKDYKVYRLKIRRIFKNLESFVSGRTRDIDYRLIERT
nr:hypothetical protein [Tanacetum cinerariifolium]